MLDTFDAVGTLEEKTKAIQKCIAILLGLCQLVKSVEKCPFFLAIQKCIADTKMYRKRVTNIPQNSPTAIRCC